MLDKLSSALKKTTDKIANAIFLDKNLVDNIVKDLQRALIEADVNVSLVLEITKKIKQAALDERIKGIEKKEHIIKLLHDELIGILGEKRDIKLQKKNVFLLVGLYGQGKCVHADTKIQLSDGNINKVKELYNNYALKNKQEELEDGYIIDTSNENLFVPSFNPSSLKIENKRVTHLWKLKKEDLYEIYLDNGNNFSIKVTPEHPFFILRNGKVIKAKADEIKESDFVSVPINLNIQGKTISLLDKIKQLHLLVQLSQEKIKEIIDNREIKAIHKNLKQKSNYCTLTIDLKNGRAPVELIDDLPNIISIKEKEAHKFITMPTFLNSDFAEFLGYLMGDGNVGKNYVSIVNEDPEIIARVTELSKTLFNLTPSIKRDFRTKRMYKILLSSKTLVQVLSIFGLKPGAKGRNLKIPEEILLSNNETVRQFIKAYFDCDSSPSKDRHIELTSESQILIHEMSMLLKRFEIVSKISKKDINEVLYFKLSIDARYAEKYANKIGYLINHKKEKVKKYHNIGLIQGCGNQDMIPLGKFLKETRQLLGFSIGEIQNNTVYSYGRYEEKGLVSKEKLQKLLSYYALKKNGIYFQLFQDIEDKINLKKKYGNALLNGIKTSLNNSGFIQDRETSLELSVQGQNYLQKMRETDANAIISTLNNLANSEVCWLPIRSINKIKNDKEYVYDLTVEDNHSFIAEGFIVHNTTTISKLASYYGKRGHSVCAIGLDVHRPAAPEQLKQLCEKLKVTCFIDKNEKDPKKIWKTYESELSKYEIVLVDSAGRDALDSELIKEIKDVSKMVKATETFLVMAADIGQSAKKQAQVFKESANVTGVIITRMDSTAKAGGALTACAEVKSPVVFIGTGEKPSDLETFDPESFLSRLLGMGDLAGLMEKIHSVVDKDKMEETQKKLQEGKFTLRDLQTQLESMESLGSMDKLLSMVPGLSKAKDKIPESALENQQEKLKKWKHAINSMTKEEVENPEILEKQTSRMQRIAKGSGTSTTDIRMLIKQYKMLNEMIKSQAKMTDGTLDQKTMMKLARKFGGKMKF